MKVRKSYLFIAAGAAAVMCGCGPKAITGPKPVIPAPLEDPAPVAAPAMTADPGKAEWESAPAPQKNSAKSEVAQFEPLTGAIPTGGIESNGKGSKKSASKVSAKGGVYIVKSGDTPDRIARKHGVRLSALMAANNLDQQSARRLQVGQKVTIPGKNAKFAAPKKSSKKPASAGTATATAAVDSEGKYTVQSGDTPERIARKNRVRLSELLKANNLDQQSARRLQIGQKLIIPGKAAASEAATTVPPVIPPVETTPAETVDQPVTTEVVPPTAPAVVETTGAVTTEGDANSDIEVTEITEDTTAAALAAKYNVPESVISEKNSGKTEFKKGDVIFVPTKK